MNHTKTKLKEVWKDLKVMGASTVAFVCDTATVPVAICKDIKEAYAKSKESNEVEVEVQNPVLEELEPDFI